MDSDDLRWIKDQKAKIENNFNLDRDRYNTLETPEDETLYHDILDADLRIAPKGGQTWATFLTELKVHIQHAAKKNIKIHIIKGSRGKAWFTHTRGDGCFMCEDINLIHVMYSVMLLMAEQYPKNRF